MLTSLRLGGIASLQSAASNRPSLKKGDKGEGVVAIQELLLDLGYKFPVSFAHGVADGIFGDETKRNVEAFQRSAALQADGIVGQLTLKKLDQLIAENNVLEQHTELDCDIRDAKNRSLPMNQRTCVAR